MPPSSFARTSFLGGEWSQAAQGRFDLPAYATSLNVCLNALPTEQGAWSRRSGSIFCGATRGAAPGRVISFEVSDTNPIGMEFTDGFLRFRTGQSLVVTNDVQTIVGISTANPAVVQTKTAHGWSTGNTVLPQNLGINNPLLQNRQFTITVVDTTHFSLQDAITGANIDGSTLGTFVSGTIARVLEFATTYATGSWQLLRSVQAEAQTVLLNGTTPQVLTLTSAAGAAFPTFTLNPANFLDGPYLDPFSGSICTYSAQNGNITLTFSFQAYSATTSYNVGDYVTYSGQGYQSLAAANEGNTPSSSPTKWTPVNGGAPVGPNGFTSGDIGRHIRLFSQPANWSSTGTYSAGAVVTYNGAYWQYLSGGSGNPTPGTTATTWVPVTGSAYALWTWGRILSVTGTGLIPPGTSTGSMTLGGGLAAAFDGNISKTFSASAQSAASTVTAYQPFASGSSYAQGSLVSYGAYNYSNFAAVLPYVSTSVYAAGQIIAYNGYYYQRTNAGAGLPYPPPGAPLSSSTWTYLGPGFPGNGNVWSNIGAAASCIVDAYVGQNYSASPKTIQQATIFPANDIGFANNTFSSLVINLRGSATPPVSPSSGTLLGQQILYANQVSAVTVQSANTTTPWSYVWFELVGTQYGPCPYNGTNSFSLALGIAQAEFFSPNIANGSVVTMQLAGPALIYPVGSVIQTWRAGLYTNNGNTWPTCGCYDSQGGRLWLAGAAPNRADASQSNDIFNFAPTEEDGTVTDADAISAVFNSKKVNTVFWMEPSSQGILVGTDGGEYLIQPLTAGAITPTNIDVNPVTQERCANIEPVWTEHTLAVVHRRMRKIFEFFADVISGKYTAPNLMDRARHMTANYVQEVRYQQEITPTIWFRDGAGALFGGTYRRDTLMTSSGPTFMGWFRVALGSGRQVQSITIGASQGGTLDALSMVTNDPATNVHHVEMMADIFEETDTMQSAWFLDDAVTPTSYVAGSSSVTFNGLWHLNGKTATVFAAGLDCGDYAVSSGSLTVPYGDGISEGAGGGLFTEGLVNSFAAGTMPVAIGFTFTSDGQLTRPMTPLESGARTGPALAKKRRQEQIGALIVTAVGGTQPEAPATAVGLQFGTSFSNLYPAKFTAADDVTPLAYGTPFSGVYWDSLDDTSSFDGMVCWRISRPWPCLIAAVEPFGAGVDK